MPPKGDRIGGGARAKAGDQTGGHGRSSGRSREIKREVTGAGNRPLQRSDQFFSCVLGPAEGINGDPPPIQYRYKKSAVSSTARKATKESNRDLPQPVAAPSSAPQSRSAATCLDRGNGGVPDGGALDVAAPEECSSNSATLSRSLATSASKAASLSSNGSDDMPGGGAFGGTRQNRPPGSPGQSRTRPGCAFATVFPGTTAPPVGALQYSDMTASMSRLVL